MTRRRKRPAAAATRPLVLIGFAIPMLFLIGLSARSVVRRESPPQPDRHIVDQASLSSADINAAANQLSMSVKRWVTEDRDVPAFAKDKIEWLTTQQKAGTLSITLLANIANTDLDFEAREDVEEGGESACMLPRLCPKCGAPGEAAVNRTCSNCGAALAR